MIAQRDIWRSRYYVVLRRYMTIVGIWPHDTLLKRCLIFSFHLMLLLSLFVPQMLYVFNIITGLDDLLDCLPEIFALIVISFKITIMIINMKKIKAFFKMIEEDWRSLKTYVEEDILRRQAVYVQHIIKFYEITMLLTAFIYFSSPFISTILNSDRNPSKPSRARISKFPCHVEYGDKLNHYLFPLLIMNYLTVFTEISIVVSVDSFYFVAIQHACGMFAIIGHALENIGKDSDDNFSFQPDKMEDDDYKLAFNCLRRHLNVLQFADMIESTFTYLLLTTANMNMITSSVVGIQIVMNLNNSKNIFGFLIFYVALLIHLFLLFWQAQLLQNYSLIPYESILTGRWYFTSRRCRMILLLIMRKAMSTCQITAGKIFALSIESFGTVLKTSLSYFTILRSLQ